MRDWRVGNVMEDGGRMCVWGGVGGMRVWGVEKRNVALGVGSEDMELELNEAGIAS